MSIPVRGPAGEPGTVDVARPDYVSSDSFNTRTTHTVVIFNSPFTISGIDEAQPAGSYDIDRDEELIDIVSRLVWRRVATFMHLPARGMSSSTTHLVPINPDELEAALRLDSETAK